jgi:hypothetical protein
MKLNLEERRFESIEDSFQISGRDEDADTKWLWPMLPIMELVLESLYNEKGTTSKEMEVNNNFNKS